MAPWRDQRVVTHDAEPVVPRKVDGRLVRRGDAAEPHDLRRRRQIDHSQLCTGNSESLGRGDLGQDLVRPLVDRAPVHEDGLELPLGPDDRYQLDVDVGDANMISRSFRG